MITAINKLNKAKTLIEQSLDDLIISLSINIDYKRLQVILKDGVQIYIVYNNYDEYSYSIIFSKLELDRCRFDNYDKVWDISTKPHHFHLKNKKEVVSSNMTGNPDIDIPLLCKFLKIGQLK